ncbi:O-antigen ligase [Methylacidimicrobium sp. B4]|uniref:O-antigen ligase family protein n=1 Tax=Methylacidimicrobium sp. B4 TaxID=2796139 RepID=UPI001A8D85BB|nr:O-antigen ligase family protein [Methylacidimicrobium sp. B4]QSR85461.1 O-antigen ligase family protein [Methylacidimicrobium sp. B4]
MLAPWLFGAVELWAQEGLYCATSLLLAAQVARAAVTGRPSQLPPGWLPAACFLSWIACQAIPIPAPLVALLSPERFRLEQIAAGLLGAKAPSWLTLSVDPVLTRHYLWEFLGIALFTLLLWNVIVNRDQLRRLLLAIIANGALLTLFAIIQRATWGGAIYWVRPIHLGGDPFGPYVNRTHMGGLLLLIIPLGLGFFSAEAARWQSGERFDWRAWVRLPAKELFERLFLPLLLLLMAAGVLTSKSRGALTSLLLGLLLMALWFASRGREGRTGAVAIVAFVLAALLAALWVAADLFFGATERLAAEVLDPKESNRIALWSQALDLWKRFPWTGSGMGTFEPAFHLVRKVFPGNHGVTHAESDYVQLLCDTGVVGLGLAIWLVVALLAHGWHAVGESKSSWREKMFLGGVVSVVGACLQGLANFDLSIMANWLYVSAAVVVMGKAAKLGMGSSEGAGREQEQAA